MQEIFNEKIIFSNDFNEAELLRTFSKNGFNTFGVRVLNDQEISSLILAKCGKSLNGKYINDKDQSFIYLKLLGGKLDDSINIKNAINSFRDCVSKDTLSNMELMLNDLYKEKKNTIINAYTKYIEYKENNNLFDKYDIFNFILDNNLKLSDIDIEYFTEFNITKTFLEVIKNVFNNVKEVSISNYFIKNNNNIEIIKSYGKSNEINSVFNKINSLNIPIDKCQIILTNPKDINELLIGINKYNISYTSTIGESFINSKPGILLKVLMDLKNMNYGVDGYKLLFNSKVFNASEFKEIFTDNKFSAYRYNEFIKYAGWLRIGFNNDVIINNNLYDIRVAKALHKINNDMMLGIVSFIKKYVIDDITNYSSISKMEELINYKNKYNLDIDDDILLSTLFDSYINKSSSAEGKIHITNIDKAFSSLRDYNFIIGLDDDFPGNPKENYLIYDEEYIKTGSNLYVSSNIVNNKINKTKKLIEISNNTILSYPFYSLFDLKEKNPSSIIYDLLNDGIKVKEYNFISDSLNENKDIILARTQNKKAIITNKLYDLKYNPKELLNKEYSPSTIHNFFENKLSFVLSFIFGIKIDDKDNPYDIIQANTLGTLIHELMEGFDKSKISKEEFMNKALNKLNEFFEMRPPIISESKNKVIQDYKNIISNLYEMDLGNECVEFEEEIRDVEISGIKFKGIFDRIEKTKDGKYILVDYKTGRTVKHKENDTETCLQGLIYAYMIEHTNNINIKSKGIRVDRIEFRYPYSDNIIPIYYDKEKENEMLIKIEEFKNAIINHDFSCPDDEYSYVEKYEHLLSLFKEVKKDGE